MGRTAADPCTQEVLGHAVCTYMRLAALFPKLVKGESSKTIRAVKKAEHALSAKNLFISATDKLVLVCGSFVPHNVSGGPVL